MSAGLVYRRYRVKIKIKHKGVNLNSLTFNSTLSSLQVILLHKVKFTSASRNDF